MKGVEGIQMSEKKFLILLERKQVIPHRLSTDQAKILFNHHSQKRRGYLQYDEFRTLMHQFYSATPPDHLRHQETQILQASALVHSKNGPVDSHAFNFLQYFHASHSPGQYRPPKRICS